MRGRKGCSRTTSGELIAAIRQRDEQRVRAIVEADSTRAEERDENGVSALMLTHYHQLDDAAVRSARSTPLDVFEAATVGDLDRLRELLDADPTLVHALSSDQGTALHFGSYFNQPEVVVLLMDRGADVHAVSPTFGNVTPLHSAAAAGNNAGVRALLAAGADPNARQDGGFAAIHTAAFTGNEEMADDLIAAGADLSMTTDEGKTADAYAAENGHEALAARLR
jgi:uncharacterized protein